MEQKLVDIANRIKSLREILEISVEDLAKATDTTLEEVNELEKGERDFSFTFLLKCADKFGVDMTDLLTGESPTLSHFTVVRKDSGLEMTRRRGFKYLHKAHLFKNKLAEPFVVTAPYIENEQDKPISLSVHDGQEFDFILSGSLKTRVGDKLMTLNAGDSIFYDSSIKHGMIAVGGAECKFLAVVIKQN